MSAKQKQSKPWAVLDAESDPFKFKRFAKPFLWGFYDGITYRTFASVDECIKFLSKNAYTVYAHNGGKFDYHFMLDKVISASPSIKNGKIVNFSMEGSSPKIISGRLAEFHIGKSTFRDSFNILPISLKQYAKDKVDYGIFEADKRDIPENRKKIEEYLKTDCLYLYEIVKAFRDGYGNGLTLAGSALKTWEQISLTQAPESTEAFYNRISPWYMGGRVECFESGIIKDEFNVYDINSAYPFAMLSEHPISVGFHVSKPSHRFERIRTTSLYKLKAISDGAFALRSETGSLWFPKRKDGIQEFHVTGWEYLAAMETKTVQVIDIIERLDFMKTINFKQYVNHFYTKRLAAKLEMKKYNEDTPEWREWKAQDIINKTFMNGLYGKFGACPNNYKHYTILDAKHYEAFQTWRHFELWKKWKKRQDDDSTRKEKAPESSDYTLAGEWPDGSGDRILMMTDTQKKRYYNVALAASVTGYVRAMIWRAVCAVKAIGCRVLYCDTDSISVVGAIGDVALKLGDELGQWKHEATCDYGAICGKKLYAFHVKNPTLAQITDGKDWKMAHKGVRVTHLDIVKMAQGETITYEPEAPTASLKGVNRHILDKQTPVGYGHVKKKKKAKSKSKRIREGSFVFTPRQVKMTV